MRVGAADVLVRRLVRSQCVYVTVGTTHTAMKEIVPMTTLPLYSTHVQQGTGSPPSKLTPNLPGPRRTADLCTFVFTNN